MIHRLRDHRISIAKAAPVAAFCLFKTLGAMTALAWVLAAFDGQAAERQVPRTKAEVQLSFAPLVKKAAPAVVNIYARKVVQGRRSLPLFDDPFFRRFFGEDFGFRQPQKQQQNSLGSGVIVRPDGLIVTNKHVIEGADQMSREMGIPITPPKWLLLVPLPASWVVG